MATVALLALVVACSAAARTAEKLVLVTPRNTVDTVISELILRQACRRIGVAVQILKFPAERARQGLEFCDRDYACFERDQN